MKNIFSNQAHTNSGDIPLSNARIACTRLHVYFSKMHFPKMQGSRFVRRAAAAPCASVVFTLLLFLTACTNSVPHARPGADISWTTYEAEEMKTNGTILGPNYEPFHVETESSNQRCVRLAAAGDYLEFSAQAPANAIVVRYSLPDSDDGQGTQAQLVIFVNGKQARAITVDSHYTHLYGVYPFTNNPSDGKQRNFYDEARMKDLVIAKGDTVRINFEKAGQAAPEHAAAYCIVDFVDLENVAPPIPAPANSLSIRDYGAKGDNASDDTAALRDAIVAAQKTGKPLYVPAGDYKLTGDIVLTSPVVIQGAGMWHTNFIGDPSLYNQADRRVRFKIAGKDIHLADFSIIGKLNYRNDDEANDGIIGAGCVDSTVSRIWVEHTKCGAWIYNGTNLLVEGCRFRNTIADGINLCVGTNHTTVQNTTTRNTGDDCFAIWPAAFDQGYTGQMPQPGHNTIRHCTGQLPFLANGGALYGGAENTLEDCEFTDIAAGCGVLISTTFPTADDKRGIDNNFSGTTTVRNVRLQRCGGYDHGWAWRGAFQLCVDRKSIFGLRIADVEIRDSLSYGFTVVGPGSVTHGCSLADSRLERVNIVNSGIGVEEQKRQNFWARADVKGGLTLIDSKISKMRNDSKNFVIAP